nr:MAG TPA: hypothetical protein [Caudoviricetes sp.]
MIFAESLSAYNLIVSRHFDFARANLSFLIQFKHS